MTYQSVEKLSESSLQILCGKCVKEARILWSEQAGYDNNHMLLVLCHDELRMVIVDQFQIVVRKTEQKVEGVRIQLTWESLRDLEDDYLVNLKASAADGIKLLQERLKHIEMFFTLKTSQEPQKRPTRFEALATELEE